MVVHESIVDAIGNTPIVKLKKFHAPLKHNLLAKCEYLNPGGSVKDRIAKHMIECAEKDGRLKPGGTMIEATAGNTGIGLAMVAALRGYKLIVVMSQKVSKDKVRLLERMGAQIVITPSGKSVGDPEHFMSVARALAEKHDGWLVDQFNNPDNIKVHYEVTGPEIWEQTEGQVDAIVAGVGTGGTLSGAGKFLKERKPSIKVVLADPIGSLLADSFDKAHSAPGSYLVEGIGQDFIPGNFLPNIVDAAYRISDEESVRAAYELMHSEGIFVGSSAGCIVAAAARFCIDLDGENKNVVAILPDGGRAYMSTIYDDSWIEERVPKISEAFQT